ncbi:MULTISPECIES: hypothetical protein [unclassified Saccharopolyspora]|uniref:hypothetical protein n=1 Tax=unclassified Saccharopolyspora TaxID=2646250 RepID=UPI001CD1C9CB|nr:MULTISPECIES: hypothetical protein [unclassified Saccharopolyspora]MCA1187281.1 hypothetical protein [Saccharopolyspora sp. 6T]MCA1195163.1 hypothetical protein [Saccharopolyspora sp. 6V]MCA1228014.1 hypothetical protein [Saccharopolyspora sp. 6M]MCA1281479.1 hypothetical protein [Saccharopolyspora sp. 7B]
MHSHENQEEPRSRRVAPRPPLSRDPEAVLPSRVAALPALQRTIGNAAVADMITKGAGTTPRSRPVAVQRAGDDESGQVESRGKRRRTGPEAGAGPGKRTQVTDPRLARITELIEGCTCKPQTKQAGRMTADVSLRHERSFGEDERAAQTLRHISIRMLRVINYLEDAEREQSFAGGDEASQGNRHARTESEVQTMLINGRVVIATNYNSSITLLKRHFPEELEAESEAMEIDEGSPSPHAGDWVRDLLLDEGRRPPVPGFDDERRKEARGKLNEVYRGGRKNPAADALRTATRVEELDGAPADAAGRKRLLTLLTSDDHRSSVILLRGPGTNASMKTMHAEQKHLLALNNSGADREQAGRVVIRGQRRPCRSCWALLDLLKRDFDLDVHERPGAYYKESAQAAVEHFPSWITDVDEEGRSPLATKLTEQVRMNVSAKGGLSAGSQAGPSGGESPLHPVRVDEDEETGEARYALHDQRIEIGYDTGSDSEADDVDFVYEPRVKPLPAITENISKNKAKSQGRPAGEATRESAAKGTTKFTLSKKVREDLELAKNEGVGDGRDPRSRGGNKPKIRADQWPIIDQVITREGRGSGAAAAFADYFDVSETAISNGRKTYIARRQREQGGA